MVCVSRSDRLLGVRHTPIGKERFHSSFKASTMALDQALVLVLSLRERLGVRPVTGLRDGRRSPVAVLVRRASRIRR